MQITDNNICSFLALVRAGLWEKDVELREYGATVFDEILRLAEEQSMVGIVAAGIEHIVDVKVPKDDVLRFVGQTLQLEQQNQAMNYFIGVLVDKMRKEDIYTLLVKGQGIAQCYERPLWRACGDVDLYLSDSNYQKAKEYLTSLASEVEKEDKKNLHLGMTIDPWVVELHGSMHTELSKRINKGLDDVHKSIFYGGEVRSWNNDRVTVFLPSPDNDIIIVFTHFLQHFFIEGVGLRQICDWCRLIWKYHQEINLKLLKERLRKMGLMTEWKVFGALAVDTLGMPEEAMPFYDAKFGAKSEKVLIRVLKSGNMGYNNDLSYRVKYTGLKYKLVSLWRRFVDFWGLITVFPFDAPKFFGHYVLWKLK